MYISKTYFRKGHILRISGITYPTYISRISSVIHFSLLFYSEHAPILPIFQHTASRCYTRHELTLKLCKMLGKWKCNSNAHGQGMYTLGWIFYTCRCQASWIHLLHCQSPNTKHVTKKNVILFKYTKIRSMVECVRWNETNFQANISQSPHRWLQNMSARIKQ